MLLRREDIGWIIHFKRKCSSNVIIKHWIAAAIEKPNLRDAQWVQRKNARQTRTVGIIGFNLIIASICQGPVLRNLHSRDFHLRDRISGSGHCCVTVESEARLFDCERDQSQDTEDADHSHND